MAGSACWGVEIGSGGLKAVKLVRDGDNVAVADLAWIPHKKPLSAPEIDAADAQRVALGTLVSQWDLGKTPIAISMPGSQSFAKFAKLPPVEAKGVANLVKFEAVQQIPFPIDEVQWDYQAFSSADSPELEVGIFAIRTETVMETLTRWQDVGRMPEVLTLSPLAAYNAVAYDQRLTEASPGTVILDIGTSSSDLIVIDSGRVWIRTFPMGGHNFTEALVAAFNISYVKAEKLKSEAETSQHARQILQAMRPVFSDLAADVQRSISYYTSTHPEVKLTRLIGLGSTFSLPGLKKFLSQQLQMEVVKLDGWQRLSKVTAGAEKEAIFKEHASEFGTAVGLALQGIGEEAIGANLVPMDVVRESIWNRKTPWFIGAAALLLLAGGAMWLKPILDRSAYAQTKPSVISEAKSELNRLKGAWQSAAGEYQADPKIATLLSLTEGRELVSQMLSDASDVLAQSKAKLAAMPQGEGMPPAGLELGELSMNYSGPAASTDVNAPPPDPNSPVKGTVQMSMRVTINRSTREADRFVQENVKGWLEANNHRFPGYMIKDPSWAFEKSTTVPMPGADPISPGNPGGGGGGGAGGGGGGGLIGDGPRTPAPGAGGGGRRPVGDGGGGGLVPGGPRPGSGGGGGRPGSGGGGGGGGAGGDEGIETLAPIPTHQGLATPGSTLSTYLITWNAVIGAKPAAPAAEEGKK